MSRQRADLTGRRFGRLEVLRQGDHHVSRNGRKNIAWVCRCDCGVEKSVRASVLVGGHGNSCGCLRSELSRAHFRRVQKNVAARRRLPGNTVAIKSVVRSHFQRCRERNIDNMLTAQEIESLIAQPCYYCGAASSNILTPRGHPPFHYNGIDRKVNSIGYTPENCVTCCWPCNEDKGATDHDEFILLSRRRAEHTQHLAIHSSEAA